MSFSDEYFDYKIKLFDECDESVDIIVLPEYSSSVSFSEDSEICGASMVVSPEGKVLENMRGRFGKAVVEFDSGVKYLKPAGYGNPDAPHYEYIEYGHKPWQYRQSGSAVCLPDNRMPYPRVCAHRGFSAVAPENSMNLTSLII